MIGIAMSLPWLGRFPVNGLDFEIALGASGARRV
jgi:hypothetical protein